MTLLAPDPAGATAPSFAEALADHGGRIAVVHGDDALSYAELDRRVDGAAAGLGTGRRLVAVEAANRLGSLVAYLAALRGGHPVLLVPPAGPGRAALLAAYDPDTVMGAGHGWEPEHRRPAPGHDLHPDLCLLLATSGSTGSAKVVRLSHHNVQANAAAIAGYLHLTPEDRAVTTLPLHYCYGLSVVHSHLAAGAGVVLSELSVVDRCFWALFRRTRATSLAGVPYTFEAFDRVGFPAMSLPHLRYVTQAGGRLAPDAVRRYAELGRRQGWQLYVMYGQTEATARMAYLPPHLAAAHAGAIGVPIPGGSFAIEPVDGAGVGVGELVFRGPNVMLGYATGPADLALGRTTTALRTGDLARRTAAGLYELVGRRSRFVKPYGVRVDLDHLERALAEAVGGRTGAVVCAGDDEQVVVAVEGGAAASAAVAQLARQRTGLPPSALRVVGLDAVPRLENGKPDYGAVRRAGTGAPAPAPATAPDPRPVPGDAVRALYAEVLGRPVDAGESFVTAGGDSLSYVELSVGLEAVLGSLPRDWPTRPVRDLVPRERGRRPHARVETSVVLRAVAIVLVVGNHAGAWWVLGGAHTLLGVAGFNFARFPLRSGRVWRTVARLAVPSMCWIALVAVVSERYDWTHALLVHGVIGDGRSPYWFIEVLVMLLGLSGLALAVPAVRRLERRRPFALAAGVAAAALVVRVVNDAARADDGIYGAHEVAWLVAVGWAAAAATTARHRLVVSALIAAAIPGWFDPPAQGVVVAAGLLLLVWLPDLRAPRPLVPAVGAVAAASLAIYLVHWQVFPPLVRTAGPAAAVAGAVAAGVAGRWAARRAVAAVS